MVDEVKEENLLAIDLSDTDSFIMSSAREKSITRDISERLVFAQLSAITYENVSDYYARLYVLDYAYRGALLTGSIFDDEGNQLEDRELKVIDFVSRIGVKTNLKENNLRNFLTLAADRLLELFERSAIDYEYDYDQLLARHTQAVAAFLSICDLNQIGRVDATISSPGLVRALDLALISATFEALEGESRIS